MELRADSEEMGQFEGLRIKCQREFVNKARLELAEGPQGKKRTTDGGRTEKDGTLADERERKSVMLGIHISEPCILANLTMICLQREISSLEFGKIRCFRSRQKRSEKGKKRRKTKRGYAR